MISQLSELRLQVGGAVNPRSGLYIVRPSDEELPRLLERGEYANVFCSRQTGKTSLLKRTKLRLIEKGYATAEVEVAGYLGTPNNADEWYQGLLDGIADQLRLNVDVEEWWKNSRAITANQRLIKFFRDEIAAKISAPVVIFLDEIDSTIALPYTDDFFVAIRAMYNDRASEPIFERITFCLVGLATPDELIKNRRTTPYNIGRTIELPDFDVDRDDLHQLFSEVSADPAKGEAIVRALIRWTGGHPYLTMRLCDQFVMQGRTSPDEVDEMVNKAFASLDQLHADVHFEQALRFLDKRVTDKLVTLNLYRRIHRGEPVPDQPSPAHIALKLAGIVKRDGRGMLAVRNEIYRRLFTEEWAAETAEDDAREREEIAGLKAFAEVNEKTLREALDDYRLALGAYKSLKNNQAYAGEADELWAQFFDRRALREKENMRRDEELLWRMKALSVFPNNERASAVSDLLGNDLPLLRTTCRHQDKVGAVAFSPDGRRLLTGSNDYTAQLWDVATGLPAGRSLPHNHKVLSVAFSPDGHSLLTGCGDGKAYLWNAISGEQIGEPLKHDGGVNSVAFSPDGDILLTCSADRTARLWDAATRKPIGQPLQHDGFVFAVAFSLDGRVVLTGSWDKTARLWDTASGRQIALLRHDSYVDAVAFSPDGRTVLTGSHDDKARLWNTMTGQPIGQPLSHEDVVYAVAFHPEGHILLTGSWDKTARLWDAASGQPIAPPFQHNAQVNAVAFSPDGRTLLTGSSDNTARLWDASLSRSQFEIGPDQKHAVALLNQWQRRLSLRINEEGEIIPLEREVKIDGISGARF